MEFIQTKTGPIASYAIRPVATQPNLVVLHGALGSSERLLHLGPRLAGFNLMFCDLRGHGHSDMTASGYEPAALAADLVAPIAANFGDAPFAVIGASFSGIVAVELSRLLPRLQCLVMLDTPFDNLRMSDSLAVLFQKYHRASVEQRHSIAGLSASFFGFDVARRTLTPLTFFHCLEGLRLPLMMVTGSRKAWDRQKTEEPGAYFSAEDQLRIGETYEGPFWVSEIAGAGHLLLKTHAEPVAMAIRPFLDRYAKPPVA
ncbi:alpha/beta fold hydrolase [Dongia sp. agr-C8]